MLEFNFNHHFPDFVAPPTADSIKVIVAALHTIITSQEKIMSEISELKASVAELKKDSARALETLVAVRQSNVEIQAALDDLKTKTNFSPEDRADIDEIKVMVADSDSAIETAVPEAVVPPPAPDAPPSDTPV